MITPLMESKDAPTGPALVFHRLLRHADPGLVDDSVLFTGAPVFHEYPSIEALRDKSLARIQRGTAAGDEYALFEKVHGSNFGLVLAANGNTKYQRRTAFLNEGEKFHGVEKNEEIMAMLARMPLLKDKLVCGPNEQITLFGELYGAGIQKAVDYGPALRFVAFDLAIGQHMVKWRTMAAACAYAEIPYLRPLAFGPFDRILATIDVEAFKTTLNPAGPPEGSRGVAEGMVLRSIDATWQMGVDHRDRPILKIKRRAFAEHKVPVEQTVKREIEASADELTTHALAYVTAGRLASVRSKLLQDASVKEVGEQFTADVLRALAEDEIYMAASAEHKKVVAKRIKNAAFELLRTT